MVAEVIRSYSAEPMEKIPSPELAYTGTQVNYYFVCRRKLWLFSRNQQLSQDLNIFSN
jgi:hypothetical protein